MERPGELRAICQAGKNGDPGWYVIHRKLSIYLTWLFLRAKVPLGIVSASMMGLGIGGALLVASNHGTWNAVGFVLLYFAFLLDKVDGEMARYRRVESVRGILLDRFYHRLVEPGLFLAVAARQAGAGSHAELLAVGAAVALLANVIDEVQHLSPYILLKHVRETGSLPTSRLEGRWSIGIAHAAALFRPLKMFRMFIIAIPSFAAAYAVQRLTGWPAPTYYLYASALGLGAYLVFQCVYYYLFKLDAEIAAILSQFPTLDTAPLRRSETTAAEDAGRGEHAGESHFPAGQAADIARAGKARPVHYARTAHGGEQT
ncbi:MAG: CDP-alcohol phosphatidyltransferase family protein [Candidatus Eisenbacteria bacterium]|uniref:CDP-alcohol phosphatidyltransferase family protein n=1 Tax=Eiseniibacteriota bacterium TaxID=2212470 RepID=A0A538T2B7_UNCEI|nr:MAG: CDP-alcohol phosphatidyltransferase family protein [Candidatus Eisenbacteria bacterium]